MISQEELNSRITENSDKILLIFSNQNRLQQYQCYKGIDRNKYYYATEFDLRNENYLIGKRYFNWNYIDDNTLNNMRAEYNKESQLFKRVCESYYKESD